MDNGFVKSVIEDPSNNLSDLISFETFLGLCSNPTFGEQYLPSSYSSPIQPMPYGSFSYEPMNVEAQTIGVYDENEKGDFNGVGNGMMFQQSDVLSGVKMNFNNGSGFGGLGSSMPPNMMMNIPRPLERPLAERMLNALSLFKESSGEGILAQVWMPIKFGDTFILSTCDQPFLLDQMLAGYREVSREFTFPAIEAPDSYPGLPGRVFMSKLPEWTSNVSYYSRNEYLRVQHAVHHEVRGSLALPIFDHHGKTCCAVLEVVTIREKPNFNQEIENVCRVLQAVNLSTTITPKVHPKQCVSKNQRAALSEIVDILRAVCHAHRLPLALTWIPCENSDIVVDEITGVCVGEGKNRYGDENILCIEETSCYVNSKTMEGFVQACAERPLKKGQGIAGKALESNHPFFSPDVKGYDIREYPLVHHARRFLLNAAVAIRIRSTYTGADDYILEFFLPTNCIGSTEQQLLLTNLSSTMQRLCKSLRTVSDAELVGSENTKVIVEGRGSATSTYMHGKDPQIVISDNELDSRENLLHSRDNNKEAVEPNASNNQMRHLDKKRSSVEKNLSLSTLQKHFSGSLKDAAKSLGVCPTTLKRICRQHGISRWPSRKINKVNRSLRKIQTVIDSVQGVETGIKFDPISGGLIATTSTAQDMEVDTIFPHSIVKSSVILPSPSSYIKPESTSLKSEKNDHPKLESTCNDESGTENILQGKRSKSGLSFDTSDCNVNSRSSGNNMLTRDGMDTTREGDCGVIDGINPTSSGTTNSSNDSRSTANGSASSTPNEIVRRKTFNQNNGNLLKVKANYKEDRVRFKFDPEIGYLQLFEEVGKRFKLPVGTFQLRYSDDDNELVLLGSESDLEECLEVLESIGSSCIKLTVRDVPSVIGSSASSNSLLGLS